jgi:DNA end-binding protein Ku
MEGGLMLEQLHFADEVRAFKEVPLEEVDVKPAELELAKQLIAQGAKDSFDPKTYRDEVRDQIMAMIQRKVEGEDISIAPTEKVEHKIIDIMEALKASLSSADKRKPAQSIDAEKAKKPAKKKRA